MEGEMLIHQAQRHDVTSADSDSYNSPRGSDFSPEVFNDLLCPICLELFKHPIILPCSHVLCLSPCAEQLFHFNFIRCPVCRENCYVSNGIGTLPRVIALESIIDKYRSFRRTAAQRSFKATTSDSENASRIAASTNNIIHPPNQILQTPLRKKSESVSSGLDIPVEAASTLSNNGISSGEIKRPARQGQQASVISIATPLTACDDPINDVRVDFNISCKRHPTGMSRYCHVCQRWVCDACGASEHVATHDMNSLEAAAVRLKNAISRYLEKLVHSQAKVVTSLQQQRQRSREMEQIFSVQRQEINKQCDSLLAEVEHKRSLFLADLDHEEHVRYNQVVDIIEKFEILLGNSQSLTHCATELLEKDSATVLQAVTPALSEKLRMSALDCETCPELADDIHSDLIPEKTIDLRKEQALLRRIHYLNPPGTPLVDVTRCVRSERMVALFLIPSSGADVIDSYIIRYCYQDQRTVGIQETITFHCDNLMEEREDEAPLSDVALLDDLLTGTGYLFSAAASNKAGVSASSQVVQCVTLIPQQSVVPVPVILSAHCATDSSSIRVFTPSPQDVAQEQRISHFLLYREKDRKSLWRSVALNGSPEYRIFGLQPDTQYEVVVMATNPRGECQLSDRMVLETAMTRH